MRGRARSTRACPCLRQVRHVPERLVGQDIAALGMPQARGRALEALARTVAADPTIFTPRADLESAGFAVEYLEIRDADTLAPVTETITGPARVFAAVHLGRTRLIDNLPIAPAA